jgi:hypothetical protein
MQNNILSDFQELLRETNAMSLLEVTIASSASVSWSYLISSNALI